MLRFTLAILLSMSITLNGFAASHCHSAAEHGSNSSPSSQTHLHFGGHHHQHSTNAHSHGRVTESASLVDSQSAEAGFVVFVSDGFATDSGVHVSPAIDAACSALCLTSEAADSQRTLRMAFASLSLGRPGISTLLAAHSLRL